MQGGGVGATTSLSLPPPHHGRCKNFLVRLRGTLKKRENQATN